ncbi:hypothetical protein IR151_06940 [Clostridioides sp. ES-S-0006-03]|uniref:abortive infection system toxin AbiGii family protein n=1 Tax=Clostridioides sp. ES-S-0006-03 TaxID=2770775 RepID=UPI001D0C5B17|nr:hypothetical protein [Clostridioides sp. ES-S-0006-03]
MFANFNKTFKKEKFRIPNSVLAEISKRSLPKGINYIHVDNGVCVVDEDFSNIELKLENPSGFEGNTTQELLEYSYRNQEPIKIKDGRIKLDENILKLNNLVCLPFEKEEKAKNFFLIPSQFREFKIFIESNNYKKKILMKRQKYNDKEKQVFKNINDDSFVISYIIDNSMNNITFDININLDKSKDSKEAIMNLNIYKDFLNGIININDFVLEAKVKINKKEIRAVKSMISFYERILELEKIININIKPLHTIYSNDLINIEKLYRSFFENKPYKEYINLNEIEMTFDKKIDENELDKKLNEDTNSIIQFCNTEGINLLKTDLEFDSITCFGNISIEDVELISEDEVYIYKIKIKNYRDKRIYKSTIHFKNELEREKYLNSDVDVTKELSEAKTIKEV